MPSTTDFPGTGQDNTQFDPELRLKTLTLEHDDLDAAIAALLKDGTRDGLLVTRLKKRKLHLKDEIAFVLLARRAPPLAQAS